MKKTIFNHDKYKELNLRLHTLSIYRRLNEDPVIKALCDLIEILCEETPSLPRFAAQYSKCYSSLLCENKIITVKKYIFDLILYDENLFSLQAERVSYEKMEHKLKEAALNDLYCLTMLSDITSEEMKGFAAENLCSSSFEKNVIDNLASWDFIEGFKGVYQESIVNEAFNYAAGWAQAIHLFAEIYRTCGTGAFAKYAGFVWESKNGKGVLKGVLHPDPICFNDFISYATERKMVDENTRSFLEGHPANNMLLYGDRGTGKSSTVKALLNEYKEKGLRLIEVPKASFFDLPEIIRMIRYRQQKFILFIDDLVFEDSEENYTALKAILEGGLENKPDNVVIYATSNRRHLIKEKFSERAGIISGNQDDEIRAADNMQEKLSLSDRFGITVTFSSPDKFRFLEIVEGLAEKRGLKIEREILHKEALKWELWYNGRSPRTARQFIDWLEGEQEKGKLQN